jgi:hypothetical protein
VLLSTLREGNKGPTASNCADGNLLGLSAQHEDEAGKQDCCRHMIVIGIGRAVPTATVGTSLAIGIDRAWPSAQPMPTARPLAQIFLGFSTFIFICLLVSNILMYLFIDVKYLY